jgi:hypothetical protein
MHSIWLCAKSELFMKMMNKRQLIEFCETGEGKLGLLPWELAIETMVGLDAVHPRAQRVFGTRTTKAIPDCRARVGSRGL